MTSNAPCAKATRKLLEAMAGAPAAGAANSTTAFLRQTLMDTLVTEKKVQTVIGGYRPG